MYPELAGIIKSFDGIEAVVLGESILDVYLEGEPMTLCREAPVPVVEMRNRLNLSGGAANTAVNAARLGARVRFLSVTGDDPESGLLCAELENQGVPTAGVIRDPGRATLTKSRVLASSQMMVRFDQGDTAPIGATAEDKLIRELAAVFARCDVLIVSDYGCGLFTPGVIRAVAELQARSPRILVLDAREPARYREAGVTAVKPNYGEAMGLIGLERHGAISDRVRQIMDNEAEILAAAGTQIAAVTLDADGSVILERGKPAYRIYAKPAANSRAAGAGDTFVSAFALSLAAGAPTTVAGELASAAASIVVGRDHTSVCSLRDLLGYFASENKHVRDRDELAALASLYRRRGARIVFTNGCFDILHRGHITYLNRAKALGDTLIVGVNSDRGVRRLKGAGRPINTVEDRVQVLAAMSCIDHVVVFDEDSPRTLIRALRPHLYVKGGDYTRELLPETTLVESLGGRVHILPYLDDHSTAGIIDRIRAGRKEPSAPLVAAGAETKAEKT